MTTEKIISSFGNQLASVGWDELIKVVERVSVSKDKKVLINGFKVLKLIMTNFISKLSQKNISTLIDAVQSYCTNKE